MKRLAAIATLFVCLLPLSGGAAEDCWKLGCANWVGNVRIQPNKDGQLLPLKTKNLPATGSEWQLCAPTYLRSNATAGELGKEDERFFSPRRMGPGTIVRVVNLMRTDKGQFIGVQVLRDDNKCPKDCGDCPSTWY